MPQTKKHSMLIYTVITVQCYSVKVGKPVSLKCKTEYAEDEEDNILPKEYRAYLYIQIKDF